MELTDIWNKEEFWIKVDVFKGFLERPSINAKNQIYQVKYKVKRPQTPSQRKEGLTSKPIASHDPQ